MMTPNFEIIIQGANAQDLFFIEREVSDTQVIEKHIQSGITSFGMPGVIEAVILIGAVGAVTSTLAWVLKNRDKGRIKIRRIVDPNGTVVEEREFEWNKSESSDKLIEKVQEWLGGFAGIAGSIGGR